MLPESFRRLRRFLRRESWEAERASEIDAHIEIETEENRARGMSPREARDAARRKFGNVTIVREEIYHMNSLGILETLWQDLRHAARLLRLNPGFATAAILSLALGIGANTALFQLLNAVRLRTLPVKNPQELAHVMIDHRNGASGDFTTRYPELTFPVWERIRERQQGFSGIFAWAPTRFNLARGGEMRNAEGLWVSGEIFNVLGIEPLMGRLFTPADDHRGCGTSSGAVISYPFWQREFAGDPDVLGRTVSLEGQTFSVIGVTPAAFFGVEVGHNFDVAVPLCAEPLLSGEDSVLERRDGWWLSLIGRLKPGWTLAQATAQLHSISAEVFRDTLPDRFNSSDAKHYLGYQLAAFPGDTGISELRREFENPLWLLLGLAGLVLLIACANLANLILARSSAREREMGVRLVVGATRARLVRQLLAESLLLAVIGAAAGAWLAQNLSRFLVAFLSTPDNPLFVDLATDWRVLGFTAGLAVLTCLLFGLTPALRATQIAPGEALKSGARGSTAGRGRFGLRRMLVSLQVALTLVLLVGALLFSRSLRNLVTVDPGFRQEGILSAYVDFSALKIPRDRRVEYIRQLLERLRAIPGVESAAEAAIVPLSGSGMNRTVESKMPLGKRRVTTQLNRVSPGFFQTLETPLLAGRDFNKQDAAGTPRVAIVNQTFARSFLGENNPVGKSFQFKVENAKSEPVYEVVGLVEDTKYGELREEATPIAYFPVAQNDAPEQDDSFLIRSTLPLGSVLVSVKRALGEASPEIRVSFQVLHTMIQESLLRERLIATLSGFFALLAGILATIGLYGVISYMVSQRRSEIGIRMALGADRGRIVGMIAREVAVLLGTGLMAGMLITLGATRAVGELLFGLRPDDPPTLLMAVALLTAVSIAATYLPARRAARLDPTEALRAE
ncbi:MAG TPA: ABC transporter permease [Candidatus Acidoferrales bacterium]|nr:ABC transporter permease [Candidatus Acidoferrales bacterium]